MVMSGVANSSTTNSAKIEKILVGPNYGKSVLVKVDQAPTIDSGHCQTHTSFNYSFDGTTDEGKMYLSILMTAFAMQKSVDIAGYNNTCEAYGIEKLYHLQVN